LVFTAGIGEHSPQVRERVCKHAEWLGVEMDEEANQRGAQLISTMESPVSVWVVPTDEEMMIAKHTREVLQSVKVA
jgi:acetate kinase